MSDCSAIQIWSCDRDMQEVIVDIPDEAFLNTLISIGVDSNGDGMISRIEAEAVHALLTPPPGLQSQH